MISLSRFMFIPLSRSTLFFFPILFTPRSNFFCSYLMSRFLFIKWFQQKQKFPPPSTLTPSPIIQVQQSRLSQAAGDRGIAEGSWYMLRIGIKSHAKGMFWFGNFTSLETFSPPNISPQHVANRSIQPTTKCCEHSKLHKGICESGLWGRIRFGLLHMIKSYRGDPPSTTHQASRPSPCRLPPWRLDAMRLRQGGSRTRQFLFEKVFWQVLF